jgi:hypothetical protein
LVFEDEPTEGIWWAIKAVPASFPGEHHTETLDGMPVESAAIVACEKRDDNGLWVWCYLTPAAKRLFGDMIFDNGLEKNRWYYVVEIDD